MTPRWIYNRLRTMGPREIGHRLFEAFSERLQALGVGNALPVAAGSGQGNAWVTALPRHLPIGIYCTAADRVLAGDFRVFALNPCRLGFPPEWNRDPRTGTRAPLTFGRILNYRDESLVGNIKYLWEPNRHLEAVTLAQAWHLSGESRYANGFRSLVDSWIAQCPYPLGANWASGLELGIRLVNWSLAWHLLAGEAGPIFAGMEGKAFRLRWLTAIRQHCHYLAKYPSLHSSANNHLLGEQLGLLVASLTWPKWPESARWARKAFDCFQRESLAQNSPDGVNREQGIWYHHEVADMMIIAALVARGNGLEFSAAYWKRMESMLEFTASVMDCGGNVPAIGDSDDAVIVRFVPDHDFPVFRSQLATGAVLFDRGDFKAKAGEFDLKSRWLLGDTAAAHFASLGDGEVHALPRQAFPEGGYYVLGSEFESPREVRIVADAGPLGFLAIAAHGHADALSFTLSVGGQEVLIDPGTYSYHTDSEWRAYFRGTSAHNTIRVDGVDQSMPGGNFIWTRHARARCERFDVSLGRQVLAVAHDGYRRLADPVDHHRQFEYEPGAKVLRVIDRLLARSRHRFELFMHFSPSCAITMREDDAMVDSGLATLKVTWPAGTRARLARGETSPPLGWVSPRFDIKQPCSTLVVSGECRGSWTGISEYQVMRPVRVNHDR